jgi:peptidoglycan/xylan/chitin deacetylase (PgdA/CDA1 family)
MKNHRVLIVSNVRPSRTWSFANQILSEVPNTEICGIVQQSIHSTPWTQQMIAAGKTRGVLAAPGWWLKAQSLIHSLTGKIVDWFFWFAHGCPAYLNNPKQFTIGRLTQECSRTGWPLAITDESGEARVATSFCPADVHLVILLGESSSIPEWSALASSGCIRACNRQSSTNFEGSGNNALISIEHLAASGGIPSTICSMVLPWQPFDGPLGFTLKTDLITDDLLLQTARCLLTEDLASASKVVSEWANRILAPSLSQPQEVGRNIPQAELGVRPCRSTWKLCLDTLLLFSPWILGRNWFRRMTDRYPVLILAHHLVSDRPHRMGMPTEIFWRQVRFLQKHYRIVSLSEATELLRSGQLSIPTVALTFDDGYADNFVNLRAVANEVGIPSTLFITTDPVETHREFDHDLATGMTGFFPLTWDQIRYWNTRGAEFGSHTRTHLDCSSRDSESLQTEIIGSRNDLEAHLKKTVSFFAFPYGQPNNMSSEAMDVAASTYRHFVSSFGGEVLTRVKGPQSHLFRKKFYASQWELGLELQSVFDFVDAARRWFHPRAANSSNASETAPAVSSPPSPIRNMAVPPTPTRIYSRAKNP